MITIVNLRDIRGNGIERVDRSSVLGNPYRIGSDGSRADVIKMYKRELWRIIRKSASDRSELEIRFIAELHRLKDIAMKGNLILGCWCTPKACHADVIKSAIEWAIEKGGTK
jgi:hypothetical protein